MATGNKGLEQPAAGSLNWDSPLNANSDVLDKALGDAATFAVNTVVVPSTVPLLLAEYQCMALVFNGAMSVAVTYQIPSGVAGQWVVVNNTSGAFDLTISHASGGASLVIPQGVSRSIYADGTATGVIYADTQLVSPGEDTQVLYYNASGIAVGSDGLTYNGIQLVVEAEDAGTATVLPALELRRASSGTPAAGIGASLDFYVETAADDFNQGGLISVQASDVTPASEDFDMTFRLMVAGAITDVGKLFSTGVMTLSGNNVITAGQPSVTQSLGTAGIVATVADDGTKSSGTYRPTPVGGNFRKIVNGGAFTLQPPNVAGDYSLVVQVTNNGSAGVITLGSFDNTSGFFSTTNGDGFFVYITKCNGFTFASIVGLQ